MNRIKLSKFISLILRHRPEVIQIQLDKHGWANVDALITGINAVQSDTLTLEILEEIVKTDEKMRYSFNEDKTCIRANQGHSIPVDVELEEREPPEILFHGTAERFTNSIDQTGLAPQSRLYVHLSGDFETAVKVGRRHGSVVVYQVNAKQMFLDGFPFYQSVNHVWLTNYIPVQYLKKLEARQ